MNDPVGVVLQGDVADEGEMEPVVGDCAQRGNGQPQQLEKKVFKEGLTCQQLLLSAHKAWRCIWILLSPMWMRQPDHPKTAACLPKCT